MTHSTQFPYRKQKSKIFFYHQRKKLHYNYTKNQNFDPIIRQRKSWLTYKIKPVKADTAILGNKTLLRYLRKINNTTINENTDILEYNTSDSKVLCLPLSMMFIAFNISHTQNKKGHSGSEKN